ncbi:TRAP transporter small permease subunit [Desulfocurvus sp. DL9XJH121]
MIRTLRFINKICAEICGWMLSVVMILLIVDVVCRTYSTPVIGVAELAMFVMIGTVYAGLGNCEMLRNHVRVESLVEKLPPKGQKLAMIATYLVAIATIGIATYAMCDNAWASFVDDESIAGAVAYVLYPVKFVMAIGMIVYTLQLVANLYEEIKKPV